MKKSKLTLEIEKKLTSKAGKNRKTSHTNEYFIKAKSRDIEKCELNFLNLTMPEVKATLKELNANKSWSFKEVSRIWFETDVFEARALAGYWLDQQPIRTLQINYKQVFNWAKAIDNWANSDQLCSVYARIFEQMPEQVIPIYLKWKSHRNSWFRRCSMVGLFYYSRLRNQQPQFEFATTIVKAHLAAPEYYVQKGVGWTLREMYNVYPQQTLQFIESHIGQIHPDAWYAATEKLSASTKNKLLKKRKLARSEKKRKNKMPEKRQMHSTLRHTMV